ncbi:mitochondrial import protein Pam17 [Laetiporus sulphureus 93-53]|uniref:Presequence translocated-associated motor subunit PAM17 n=1 Tax=Laetiporus sulphureus 93-53 TaxID=1314785 RepID=A0A165C793_9APHY|nr:mitochondrial import protein Pam17 [Laetiporus sulphureus 93-53]KZT02323.1 mitochondrial import protein Pam17 [Laetiporus sulphureus 93-53]
MASISGLALLSPLQPLSPLRPLSRSCQATARVLHACPVPCARVRFNSTKAPSKNATGAGSAPDAATTKGTGKVTEQEKQTLRWGDYLRIRRKKRRWETAMTVPMTIAGFAGGIAYFGNLEMDPTKPIFNVDPMVVYGFATLGCAGFGYLMGPVIGSSIWRMTHRRTMALIEARDREFHQHIVKNRVDPTAQSATNPVPDFYGEKIGSLHDYRQWLRDQLKYKKKAYLPEDPESK